LGSTGTKRSSNFSVGNVVDVVVGAAMVVGAVVPATVVGVTPGTVVDD
jgi:hypothetical protein